MTDNFYSHREATLSLLWVYNAEYFIDKLAECVGAKMDGGAENA